MASDGTIAAKCSLGNNSLMKLIALPCLILNIWMAFLLIPAAINQHVDFAVFYWAGHHLLTVPRNFRPHSRQLRGRICLTKQRFSFRSLSCPIRPHTQHSGY